MGLHRGHLLTVHEDVTDALPGYLAVAAGDRVRILYVGSGDRQDEKDWVYGKTKTCKGWLCIESLRLQAQGGKEVVAKRGALSEGGGYLRVQKGESLVIDYEDSEWLWGWSHDQQKEGWFPRIILTKPSPPPEEEWAALQNKQKSQCEKQAASVAQGAEALAGPESLPSWTIGRRAPKVPWNYAVMDTKRRCFCGFLRAGKGGIDDKTAKYWANLVKESIDDAGGWDRPVGSMGVISRGTKWLVRRGCSCPYRYGGAVVDAMPFPKFMDELMDVVMPLCGFPKEESDSWPNSCNVNMYTDGSDYLDWHADDEPLFGGRHGDCCIISLSLGHERPFQLRLVDCFDDKEIHEFPLGRGALCTMEGRTQQYYQHRVPKRGGQTAAPRINLTWRWITSHDRKCRLHRMQP